MIDYNYFYFFVFQMSLNLLLFYNLNKIANRINIFDIPNLRKVHSGKVPLLGGLFLILNLFSLFIFDFIFFKKIFFYEFLLFDLKLVIIFLISIFTIFLLGFLDDKFNISYDKKIIILSIVLYFNLSIDENLQINELIFSFTDFNIEFYSNSTFFSLICFLIYMNAINMFDGINLQTSSTILVIYIFFIFNNMNFYFSIFLITYLIFFMFFNFQEKVFLGDSGSLLLGYLTAFLLVKFYNSEENSFIIYSDYIVSFMIIPVLDLLRQFFNRVIKGKNPFYPDKNHLHHRLLRKYNYPISIIVIVIIFTTPILLNYLLNFKINIYLILFSTIIYFILIYLTRIKSLTKVSN